MRAVVQHRYGGPETLELEEVGRPTSGSEQVLVLVRAAALNPTDYVVMRGRLRVQTGWRRPNQQIRGFDVAGTVEAVGADVVDLAPGDAVFGTCRGTFAEYAVGVPERLVSKPERLSFEQAAGIAVAGKSLRELRRALVPGGVVVLNCGHDVSLILAGNVARLLFRRRDVKQFVRKVRAPTCSNSPGSRRTGA
jgi:NADPH:quinone reductase-like Zn-dependent oxidoreductase